MKKGITAKRCSPFLMPIYYRRNALRPFGRKPFYRKEFNNASIEQIKDGVIQSGAFYRREVYPVPHGEQLISRR